MQTGKTFINAREFSDQKVPISPFYTQRFLQEGHGPEENTEKETVSKAAYAPSVCVCVYLANTNEHQTSMGRVRAGSWRACPGWAQSRVSETLVSA